MIEKSISLSFDQFLSLAYHYSSEEGTTLLLSGGGGDSAKISYLFLFPVEKISISTFDRPWDTLQRALGSDAWWVGYLGYEMGSVADEDVHLSQFLPQTPLAIFYRASMVIQFDHQTGKGKVYSNLDTSKLLFSEMGDVEIPQCRGEIVYRSDTLETYHQKIVRAKEWIREGEIYQVNLSQELHIAGNYDAWSLFKSISTRNPAPFSSFMQCGTFSIVSSSPERFLRKRGENLETRPIKGTAPRGQTSKEDQRFKEQLLVSEKERAELFMIVDLMRNDLGKISHTGSVVVKELLRCESYTNVHHLLSVIESRCKFRHPVEILRSLFPGGSITGCPKSSAMRIISLLENRPRGVYTGSIGYFTPNGDFDFNIAIRTLVVDKEKCSLQIGGAIGIDYDPVKEYEETLHKGRTILEVVKI